MVNGAECIIEQAFLDGKTTFKKHISCHLYPIRVKQFNALTFDVWPICALACSCDEKFDVPDYHFLKEPLIRAFGEDFFQEMKIVDKAWKDKN